MSDLSYRIAEESDWRVLLDWRNDELTRANSLTTGEVDEDTHRSWFSNSLRNPGRSIYMFNHKNELCGMVRTDLENGEVTLSWNVAPESRGKGIGKIMVKSISDLVDLPLKAFIRKSNIPSIKIAEFCGLLQKDQNGDVLEFYRAAR